MKKHTRILSLLLAMIMVFSLLPVSAFATEADTPEVVSQQLNLGDDLTMHFYVTAEEGTVVNATVDGETVAHDLSKMTPDSNGQYVIAVKLAAAQMTEAITLDFVQNDVSVLLKTYSIRSYAENILAGDYTFKTKNLVKNMLNYGAKAQLYFNVNTDDLANVGYELEDTLLPAEYEAMTVNGSVSDLRFYGASLVFTNKIAVRFYFTGAVDGVNFGDYKAVAKDGMFYVEVPGINPQDYTKSITLTAIKGEETLAVSYSPLNYIVRMSGKDTTSNALKALLNAMYGYHEAAVEYVNKDAYLPDGNGNIVINAVDAMQQKEYAQHNNENTSEEYTDVTFEWVSIAESDEVISSIQLTPIASLDSLCIFQSEDPTGNPGLQYTVYVPEAGEYYLYCFSNSPNDTSDSFYFGINGEKVFASQNVITNKSGGAFNAVGEKWFCYDNQAVTLNAGYNTIQIWARESGLLLRQIMLSPEKQTGLNEWQISSVVGTDKPIIFFDNTFESMKFDEGGEAKTVNLIATAGNSKPVNLTAESSDDNVAKVSLEGNILSVTPVAMGKATVTVTANAVGCSTTMATFDVMVMKDVLHYKADGQAFEDGVTVEAYSGTGTSWDHAGSTYKTYIGSSTGAFEGDFTVSIKYNTKAQKTVSGNDGYTTRLYVTDYSDTTAWWSFNLPWTSINKSNNAVLGSPTQTVSSTIPSTEAACAIMKNCDVELTITREGNKVTLDMFTTAGEGTGYEGQTFTTQCIMNGVTSEILQLALCNRAFSEYTVKDIKICGTIHTPIIFDKPADLFFNEGAQSEAVTLNASTFFGDHISFTAASGDENIATVGVDGNVLTVTPVAVGEAIITVTASVEGRESVDQTFTVFVMNTEGMENIGLYTVNGDKIENGVAVKPITNQSQQSWDHAGSSFKRYMGSKDGAFAGDFTVLMRFNSKTYVEKEGNASLTTRLYIADYSNPKGFWILYLPWSGTYTENNTILGSPTMTASSTIPSSVAAIQIFKNCDIELLIKREGNVVTCTAFATAGAGTGYEGQRFSAKYTLSGVTSEVLQLALNNRAFSEYTVYDLKSQGEMYVPVEEEIDYTTNTGVIDALLAERNIPDVTKMQDGTPVTLSNADAWREEAIALFKEHMFGTLPDYTGKSIRYEVIDTQTVNYVLYDNAGIPGITSTVKITVDCDLGEWSFNATQILPVDAEKCPMFVYASFSPDVPNDYLPVAQILKAGCGVIQFYYQDVASDSPAVDGIEIMYNEGNYTWGKIGMWSFAAMRIMDYLQEQDFVDTSRIAIAGHSRLGKVALWTSALDTRFTHTCVNNSGTVGDALSRNNTGCSITTFNNLHYFWVCDNFLKYSNNEGAMPFDQHFLVALIAPRNLAVGIADNDGWADPAGQYLSSCAASAMWEVYGQKGLVHPDRLPECDERYTNGAIQLHYRSGDHYMSEYAWAQYIDSLKGTVVPAVALEKPSDKVWNITDGALTVELNATASNGSAVTLSALSDNSTVVNVSLNGNVLTVTPLEIGEASITVTANAEGCRSAEQRFTIIVKNDWITLSEIPNTTLNEGAETWTCSLNATATNGNTIIYSAESSDENIATVSVDGNILSVTPVAMGETTITVIASADSCESAEQEFNVMVMKDVLHYKADGQAFEDGATVEAYSGTGTSWDHAGPTYKTYIGSPTGAFVGDFTVQMSLNSKARVEKAGNSTLTTRLYIADYSNPKGFWILYLPWSGTYKENNAILGSPTMTVSSTIPSGDAAIQIFKNCDIELIIKREGNVVTCTAFATAGEGTGYEGQSFSTEYTLSGVTSEQLQLALNNRAFAEYTVKDIKTCSEMYAPMTFDVIDDIILTEGAQNGMVNLTATPFFGGTVSFSAESSDKNVASVSVDGNVLTVTPVAMGEATITVVASADGCESAEQEFNVMVMKDVLHYKADGQAFEDGATVEAYSGTGTNWDHAGSTYKTYIGSSTGAFVGDFTISMKYNSQAKVTKAGNTGYTTRLYVTDYSNTNAWWLFNLPWTSNNKNQTAALGSPTETVSSTIPSTEAACAIMKNCDVELTITREGNKVTLDMFTTAGEGTGYEGQTFTTQCIMDGVTSEILQLALCNRCFAQYTVKDIKICGEQYIPGEA